MGEQCSVPQALEDKRTCPCRNLSSSSGGSDPQSPWLRKPRSKNPKKLLRSQALSVSLLLQNCKYPNRRATQSSPIFLACEYLHRCSPGDCLCVKKGLRLPLLLLWDRVCAFASSNRSRENCSKGVLLLL
ncbi:PREDICTED: LOC109947937 isoform [Prunus dulcis]|uniref:PREDICTED: LOC109947937 isoform n=1 Tax=Prunus dulcis TaxID=3755 RepID=A0A5E4GFK8_PRUDU|nr:PREDICTED: LOC109947937 isoform [Prunus dulcis]